MKKKKKKKEQQYVDSQIPEEFMHELEIVAKDRGMSVQEVIDQAMEQYLKNKLPRLN